MKNLALGPADVRKVAEMFLIEGIDLALRGLKADGITNIKIVKIRYFEFTSIETLNVVFPKDSPAGPWSTDA